MKILFLGLGSIGHRHARLIHEHWPEYELFAIRSGHGGCEESPKYVRNIEDGRSTGMDIIFVCTPSLMHMGAIIWHAFTDRHFFIEKPIGKNYIGVKYALELVKINAITAYVAYPMRFHPKVAKIGQLMVDHGGVCHARFVCSSYLPSWRPDADYKRFYSANESMGGGILLDMSHHAYFAEMLFGEVKSLIGIRARLTEITVDTDDAADLILNHISGVVSNIHVDFITKIGGGDRVVLTMADGSCQRVYLDLTQRETDEMYLNQLKHFFDNLDNPNLDGNLASCVPLFRKLIKIREENPV